MARSHRDGEWRFDPLQLLEPAGRAAAVRVNLVLYYGVVAPRALWRAISADLSGQAAHLQITRPEDDRDGAI